MKKRINLLTLLVLLTVLTTPFLTGCQEAPPDRVEFESSRLNLPPGAVRNLTVYGVWEKKKGPVRKLLSEGLLFHSDRRGDFSITPGGVLSIGEDLGSGETALIGVRTQEREAYLSVMVRQDPEVTVDAQGVLLDPAALDALVNKARSLPEDYTPSDLVRIAVPTTLRFEEVNHLRRSAAVSLARLFQAAQDEEGFRLYARSGYRAYQTQKGLYTAAVTQDGQEWADKYSAVPGHSEHQTGLAMDITSRGMNYQLDESFGSSPEGLWAAQNAHRFGFILRYPPGKEGITGYNYEPWHFRYVGETLAGEIYRRGFTLEEYYALPEEENS